MTPVADSAPSSEPKPESRFGDAGHFVITQALGGSIHHGGYANTDSSAFSVVLQPSLHYFFAEDISVGLVLFVKHEARTIPIEYAPVGVVDIKTTDTSVGGAVDLGANAPLSKLVSIWIRGEFGLSGEHSSITQPPASLSDPQTNTLILNAGGHGSIFLLNLFVPVLVHPTQHFFVGLGPSLTGEKRSTASVWWSDFGLSSTVGGWI